MTEIVTRSEFNLMCKSYSVIYISTLGESTPPPVKVPGIVSFWVAYKLPREHNRREDVKNLIVVPS